MTDLSLRKVSDKVIFQKNENETTTIYLSRKDRNLPEELQRPTGSLSNPDIITDEIQLLSYISRIPNKKARRKFVESSIGQQLVRKFHSTANQYGQESLQCRLLHKSYKELLPYHAGIKALAAGIGINTEDQKALLGLGAFLEYEDEGNKENFFNTYIRTNSFQNIMGQTMFYKKFTELSKATGSVSSNNSTITWPNDFPEKPNYLFLRIQTRPEHLNQFTTPTELLSALQKPPSLL